MEIDALRLWHAMELLKKAQLPYKIDIVPDEPGKFRIEMKMDQGHQQYDGTLDAVTTMLFEVARKKVQVYLEKTQQKFEEYRAEIETLRITFGWLDGANQEEKGDA